MLSSIIFNAQLSGADRMAGAQKYMGKSLSTGDYMVIVSVVLMIIVFSIITVSSYFKQKEKHKKK